MRQRIINEERVADHRFLLIAMLVALIHFVIAINNPEEKCEYKDTVELTNDTLLENGSYLYENILITKLAFYDYRLEFRNKTVDAEWHLRGCVCDAKRHCIKLCCERGQYFNESENRCKMWPIEYKDQVELDIHLGNGSLLKTVNIYKHFVPQVGLPCKNPEVLAEQDIWGLFENGLLHIFSASFKLDTVSYCFTPHHFKSSNQSLLMPMSCPIKSSETFSLLLNTYGMAISVIFIIPTILVYLSIKQLRNNLGGKLLISYLFSMAIAYSVISYVNISNPLNYIPCSILGFTGYYFFMSAFMWLSVLCFDMWNNFKEANIDVRAQTSILRFVIYSIYAWGSAGLLTIFTLWSQLSDHVDEIYKPGIGIEMCWLDTRKWSAALYFYWPNFIILVFNMVTFTNMTIKIYRIRRDVANMTNRESFIQENAGVIMRLFFIMGISWIMDIISYCLREYESFGFLFILTDLCNATQGVLIFILFILRPKVLNYIKARFQPSKPPRPKFYVNTRETNFSQLTSSSSRTASTSVPTSPFGDNQNKDRVF